MWMDNDEAEKNGKMEIWKRGRNEKHIQAPFISFEFLGHVKKQQKKCFQPVAAYISTNFITAISLSH